MHISIRRDINIDGYRARRTAILTVSNKRSRTEIKFPFNSQMFLASKNRRV